MRKTILAICLILAVQTAWADVLKVDEWTQLKPDPAAKHKGSTVLDWPDIVTNNRPVAQNVPTDLSQYKTVSFWVHSARPVESRITLVLMSDDKTKKGSDYYSLNFAADFEGWREVKKPMSALGKSRSPLGLDQISSVFFSSNWAHNLDPKTELKIAGFTFDTEPIPGYDRPAGELLLNRGFEMDNDRDGRPDGWGGGNYRTGAETGIDTSVAHTGSNSARIGGHDAKDRGGFARNFGPNETDPTALYRLSAWVKVDGTSTAKARTSIRITSVDEGGKVLASDYRVCDPGPYDWRHYEWTVTLPPKTNRFNIVLFHHGEGTAWYDDVSLKVVKATEATAPKSGAVVPDGKPTLKWNAPADAWSVVEIAPDGDFASKDVRRYETKGGEFTLPKALPLGKTYAWRATSQSSEGMLVAALKGEPGEATTLPTFFAGSQEQRQKSIASKFADQEAMYKELKALADRNNMWEKFDLLGKALEESMALAQPGAKNAAERLKENQERWTELKLRMPWWNKIFLDNEALFLKDLNLDYPGMEKVKAAAKKKDWPAAREALADYYKNRKGPNYYNKYLAEWKKPPVARESTAANRYMTHKYPIHSYKTPTFDLGKAMEWHVNPIVDREWPTKLHRHHHWKTYYSAYAQTGNEKYAEEMRQQILDWAKDNPIERWVPANGRFAWSTLNATARIYGTWINMLYILRYSPVWNGDVQFVYMTEMREHARYLMGKAARTGNWVIAEARGLVELGIMFPEFSEAKAWRDEGYARLRRELKKQVFADGIHEERTPGYHSMVMGCFMQPVRLGLLNNVEIEGKDEFVGKLEKMEELYLYGSNPAKKMAQIGDAGVMSVMGKLSQGWNVFRRKDMLYVMSDGKEGEPPVYRSYAFREGGFYVSRSKWNDPQALWSILDWGGFTGHCHYDIGNLCLYAYGSRLLIDAGRYAYAWPQRKYFKETTGHNTVMVDLKNQKKNEPLQSKWASTDQFDAFWGLTDNTPPLNFERSAIFRQPGATGPGYWLVVDRMTPAPGAGSDAHRVDQRWHGLEKLSGKVEGANVVFTVDSKKTDEKLPSLVIANAAQPGLETAVVKGWVSYGWYKKEPVDVAQFTMEKAKAPVALATVVYPTPGGAKPANVKVEAIPATLDGREAMFAQVSAVKVTIEDNGKTWTDTWVVRHADAGVTKAGGVETDARVVMVRGDGAAQWLAAEGSRVVSGGKTLFQAGAAVDGAGAVRDGDSLAFVSTDAGEVKVLGAAKMTVNGKAAKGGSGMVSLGNVKAPVVPPVPRGDGPLRFELEAEDAESAQATAYAEALDKPYKVPEGAVMVEAEKYSGQGNGAVEVTPKKIGASGGLSFLHWDYKGHWIEWAFDVPKTGKYGVVVRLCSREPAMQRKLSIDGKVVSIGEAVEFSGTTGYSNTTDDWRAMQVVDTTNKPFSIRLDAGKHVVRMENVDGVSMNVDWVALVPAK